MGEDLLMNKNNNMVDLEPTHNGANDDDAKTLITADDLLSKSGSQVTYQQRSGFDDDSMTLINLTGDPDDSFIEGSSSMKLNGTQQFQAHIQQLRYNDIKLALDRSINTVVDSLNDLKTENSVRPIYYPTDMNTSNSKLNSLKSRLALIRKNSLTDKLLLKRTESFDTNVNGNDEIPKLTILNLNLQIDQHQDDTGNIITNLNKESLASLLDQKIISTIRHLLALKDRIDDTSSKVFVTGDLNAGKSAFCNALLRRKILPEDEQPCTNVFSEVIDASENKGLEEVHAVPIGYAYNQRDQSTYSIFPLKELENLVYESDKYGILKIYVNDSRPTEQSLLKNNVIDISLIDAPGLNMDSYQTTEVFSRQEEIDLVVFVVDARNHFTLSGKEFISAAANEKNLLFIVVNKFDTVKNKDRCKSRIMDQVLSLSPDTHKDSGEFVHFVSSDYPTSPDDEGNDPSDDDDDNDDPYLQDNPDFDQLEASLRKFILEKRSLSKLLPAKNYTLNVLKDLEFLFKVNEAVHLRDREVMLKELNEITPQYEETLRQSMKVHEKINKFIEISCTEVYNFSKERINNTLNEIDAAVLVTNSAFDIYTYAVNVQQAMINKILDAVILSENQARKVTAEKVNIIKKVGVEELGSDFYNNRVFRDDLMFTKKRDSIQKKLNDEISILDFFDPSIENLGKLCGVHNSSLFSLVSVFWDPSFLNFGSGNKLQIWKGSCSALACVSSAKYVTQFVRVSDLLSVQFLLNIAKPVLIITSVLSISFLILDMPSAFQRKTAKKIKRQIAVLDYQHKNSSRIAKEVRTVLNYPAREVLNCFQTNIDKAAAKRDKIASNLKDIDLSSAFYSKAHKLVIRQREIVEGLELENLNRVD